MELVAIFYKAQSGGCDPNLSCRTCIYLEVESYVDKIDIMILCGGSATDLPEQGPYLAGMFNTVEL